MFYIPVTSEHLSYQISHEENKRILIKNVFFIKFLWISVIFVFEIFMLSMEDLYMLLFNAAFKNPFSL